MINLLIVMLGIILAMLMMTVGQFFAELHNFLLGFCHRFVSVGTARPQWTQTALGRQTLGAAFGYMHAARICTLKKSLGAGRLCLGFLK